MKQILSFAQKGIILNKSKTKILVIKYSHSKYMPGKVASKLGLPGGKVEFKDEPDDAFTREVKEETGVTIKPGPPIYLWTWVYQKEKEEKQIVALARLGYFIQGKPTPSHNEKETTIESVFWLPLNSLDTKAFIWDEEPALINFLEYRKKNPFT